MTKLFWDTKFRELGTEWGFEPSDSAVRAMELFKTENISDILIPGIGYGRNANVFLQNGINVSGIEISDVAIEMSRTKGFSFPVFSGSVLNMPFEDKLYDGIFCYALLHLFNRQERGKFLSSCFNQLRPGGFMVFSMVSTQSALFGAGKKISSNRYEISKDLKVYFYDKRSAAFEFKNYNPVEISEIDEPVKFRKNEPPMKFIYVICKHK